jgi:hypothetical protein
MARINEKWEPEWRALIIDQSGTGQVASTVEEPPSPINDQIHSEKYGSMYWGRHDVVTSPCPSNFQWFDSLFELLQRVGASKVLEYLRNNEVLQTFSLVSRDARHISEHHILNNVIAQSFITITTKDQVIGNFEETDWEHCYPSKTGHTLLSGDRVLFTPSFETHYPRNRRHCPGEFRPYSITFRLPNQPKAYSWQVDPIELSRAATAHQSPESRQSRQRDGLIVFHDFEPKRSRDGYRIVHNKMDVACPVKMYYKIDGDGPNVTLVRVSIQLRCLVGMIVELGSRKDGGNYGERRAQFE